MKIETKDDQIIVKQIYNSITIETDEGKQLHICLRDKGYEMKIDDGEWHLITNEEDWGLSEQFICPCCGSDRTYKTEAYHCNRCAVTTEV